MVYFVIDADIYWPKLVVKILLCWSKKRKGVILMVEVGVRRTRRWVQIAFARG